MTMHTIPEDRQLADLRAQFSGHRIWRSVRSDGMPGDWVATLRDRSAGVDATVIESDPETLHTTLVVERMRARMQTRMM